ncbi:putative sterol desaturase family protein [Zalerion maritima]|uniref:Sterol desaturase family protein n=1 Tax=Zalerion maritima TaxID=339359 RepID=A0AAD5RRQ5_9PEZI|nr:putative sterol desaturase family protein [Zalerion maritima]
MDALISLPLISYLLIPGTTSWSTSLNLLFFTMTWTTLTLSHPPLKIELVVVLAIRVAFWLIPSLATLLFDLSLPSIAGQLKHGGSRALPPRDSKVLGRALGLSLLNLVLSLVAEGTISYGLSSIPLLLSTLGIKAKLVGGPVFATSAAPPLPWNIAKHLVLLLAGREITTYYIHRYLLHNPKSSYSLVRKLSNWHLSSLPHSRSAPTFSLLLFADSPVPGLLLRFVPLYLPALVLRPHLLTYLAFVALATGEEAASHSGYSVVPGILLGGVARRCAVHHGSKGKGNFGAWGFLDWAYGTSAGGQDVVDDMADEAEKHNLPERGQKFADGAADKLQDGVDGWGGRLRGGGG